MAAANHGAPEPSDLVTVSLSDLRSGTVPLSTLVRAFGPTSLGILLVRDLPPQFPALRSRVLSNSSHLAHLPASKLEKLTNPKSKYLVGWSHGKETLRPGVVDTGKGSYYINCDFYADNCTRDLKIEDQSAVDARNGDTKDYKEETEDTRQWAGFEEYTAPSIWPDEEDIPGFRPSAEELITLIIDIAVLVARACDRYALEAVAGYEAGYLERVVRTSRTTKARLLHYFPSETTTSNGTVQDPTTTTNNKNDIVLKEEDDWCATHLDHGCLTGLTSAMYTLSLPSSSASSPTNPTLPELPTSPHPSAGLYIRSRSSQTVQVSIPRDCLAFQTGEALQHITRGQFKAVPHFVRGVPVGTVEDDGGSEKGEGRGIARNTLAVFTQPNLGEVIGFDDAKGGKGITFGEFARGVVGRNTT